MAQRRLIMMDGNEAAASVAHRVSEVIAIYPITPSSTMGELADEWSAQGRRNLWGLTPKVVQMQSEGGAIGAVHGSLQAGALTTTFTASQGLLLMIPNLYKIAGELTAFCFHVAARTVATHALSIFGDHSDVMACRQTGVAMLCSASVQEAHDMAAIAHASTLRARVPFMHFFDGFRTSHEINKIEELTDDDLRSMLDAGAIADHRRRALSPNKPMVKGTAENPDTHFQAREACNRFHDAVPALVLAEMERFARLTGRRYRLFDYHGHPEADRVIVMMGSGAQTAEAVADHLNASGERVGVLRVRLFRPFSLSDFIAALPASVRRIAVLDRTKEPGALGEPLYLDVLAGLCEARDAGLWQNAIPAVIGGRYGLSSKEFTPGMAKAVFMQLETVKPKNHFTVGINDDVTGRSLPYDNDLNLEPDDTVRAVFFGLGSDGTVGANKNSIKIIGEETSLHAQAYFVYDSKKSGAMTVSHLRFGPRRIRSPYLIRRATFIACHQFQFLDKIDVLGLAASGATVLLNAPFPPCEVWDQLPGEVREQAAAKKLRLFSIDADKVASMTGMGTRINTIMQTCFFAISGVLPREQAIARIKQAIEKTYGKRGEEMVRRNFAAVDASLEHLHEVIPSAAPKPPRPCRPVVSDEAPDLVRRVTAMMLAGKGDMLPVSAFPPDGAWPTGTSQWEKRSIAAEIPVWESSICIQCNKCAFVCPHAAIRAKVYDPDRLADAPPTFKSMDYKAPDLRGMKYTIQVAPEDCTGCGLCVAVCPAKDKATPRLKAINMAAQPPHLDAERANFSYFLDLPDIERERITRLDAKGSQFLLPLFEYSGACAGCGETPYLKLLTQLFGDRMVIANATGCSSIYGGNLPTTPYTVNRHGRGPAWANSLFEDNAEFGLGIRLGIDQRRALALELLGRLANGVGAQLACDIADAEQSTEPLIEQQRERVTLLRRQLTGIDGDDARVLHALADDLVHKSVWIVGGDGWAYDIGFGGLDHILASRHKVNILILDTEVYSNTGGQASKATPLSAAAKFASLGKDTHKKDLGLIAMSYGHVYVASVAFGASDNHTVKAFLEAESFPGPSVIVAYSPCIAHGYDLRLGCEQQKLAAGSGVWPLYRFDPRRSERGELPLQVETFSPRATARDYMRNETRFRMVEKIDPERFRSLADSAVDYAAQRVELYKELARIRFPVESSNGNHPAPPTAVTSATEGQ